VSGLGSLAGVGGVVRGVGVGTLECAVAQRVSCSQ